MTLWRESTKRDRCPVCDNDHWCAVSSDGRVVRCMRVVDGPDVNAQTDGDGRPYGLKFLFETDGTRNPSAVARYQPEPDPPRADAPTLHRVYSALLACLPLSVSHRTQLLGRGLDDAAIERAGYRTLPPSSERGRVMRALRETLAPDAPTTAIPADIPGLHRGKLSGAEGLLIPVRDAAGQVVAIKVRPDDDKHGKYLWLSSTRDDGPSPGSPCHVPLAPPGQGATGTVRLTEGPLKADVATHLSGVLTLGIAGCTAARSAAVQLRALRAETVRVALDADARTNRHVAAGLRLAVKVLREEGFAVAVETWDPAAGKGIDNVLQSGAGTTVHAGEAVDRVVAGICKEAGADEPPAPKAPAADASATPPTPPPNVAAEVRARGAIAFDRGDSVELARTLIDQLRALAPDAGPDGCDAVVFDRGSLWHYDPARGIYIEHDRADAYRIVSAFAGVPTGPKGKPLSLSDGNIKGAVYTAQQLCARRGFFDEAEKGTVFADCFASARAGKVEREPHSHAHRATHALAVTYDQDARIDQWLSMLREVLRRRDEDGHATEETDSDTEDCIALLQEWVGVALMGEATARAVSMVLVGAGNDGKSSVLNVIRALFPPTSVCSIAPQDWARGFLLAGLAGKRLNVVAELPERDILDSERFKAVVDGSPLTAERKNQDPFDLVCEAGHLFACNALPATRDQSKGFWRRFVVLVCERSFEAHEVVRDLWRKIVAEELAGIAAWALEGAARAQSRKGFTMPASSTAAKADWQMESDQVRQFVEDACTVLVKGSPEESPIADLFVAYRLWCVQSGHPPMARNRLGQRLRGLGYFHRTTASRLYTLKASPAWMATAKSLTGQSAGGYRAPLN